MLKIFKYSLLDMIRNRWIFSYMLFFLLITTGMVILNGHPTKVIISLTNIILALTPLVGLLFGVMYYYNSKEFIELLLTQPVSRRSVFSGIYFGLCTSLCLSLIVGIALPLVISGILTTATIKSFCILIAMGLALTIIFSLMAFLIALKFNNKIVGFGVALFAWFFFAILYDGVFLILLYIFKDYPLENMTLAMTLLNPVDLARIMVILNLDISAMMGYTGAVLQKLLGSQIGALLIVAALALWISVPYWRFLRLSKIKDF
ncbi:MAG: ABC transporter permease [Saprospiraceae bacterium]|nr:ABC transporter permease [Saprospiraceae bacterium]